MVRSKSSRRFIVQLVITFMLFALGIIIVVGAPAAWLLKRQSDRQLTALLEQTSQTTLALYENKVSQLQNLVTLLAERPTLNRLVLINHDPLALSSYLDDFLRNTPMDALVICKSDAAMEIKGIHASSEICEVSSFNTFSVVNAQGWLFASANLPDSGLEDIRIILGQQAETVFLEFSPQSGVDYLLFHQEDPVAASIEIDTNRAVIQELISQYTDGNLSLHHLSLSKTGADSAAYRATLISDANMDQSLVWFGLLNIEPYSILNRQLLNIVLLTLVVVSLIGGIAAVILSQRISKPMSQLARSASALRGGDLTNPLDTRSNIREINQLTNAFEDARISLKHTLDQLRMEKVWIEDLLNAIVEGILTLDHKNRITFASDAVTRILGFDSFQILNAPIDELFISISGEEPFSRQIPLANQSRRIPVVINNREILLSVSVSEFVPPDAGNATRALVIRDVTDEERIHKLVGEFISNITHEFRTPLAALAASVELLMDQLPELSTPEIERLLHSLNIGVINLQSLIDNLIEAASIEAGRFKVNPQPTELSTIIVDAVNTIQPIIDKRGLALHQPQYKPSFFVMADRRRTVQALINLLSNAIKHSPAGGKITISTLLLGKQVMVEIHDEGEGVSPELERHLFNRFITPETNSDAAQLGLGLGLSVVKAIIETQQGEVGYKNSETKGAVFWFTIPMFTGSPE